MSPALPSAADAEAGVSSPAGGRDPAASPSAFQTTPVVTANTIKDPNWPPGQGIADTFAVSMEEVTPAGFVANIYRVDNILNVPNGGGQGWDRNLQLGWFAYCD